MTAAIQDTRSKLSEVATGEPPGVDATDDDKGMYSFARYAAQNDHYAGFYQSWTKTILFLLGKQWLRWLGDQRRYTTDTDVPAWRQQPVTNLVYPVYRTYAAKLTKQRPTFEVVPPSGDSVDRESARLGEAILVHLWRLLKMPSKQRSAIGWFLSTGQIYLSASWDPEGGKLIPRTTTIDAAVPDQPDQPDEYGASAPAPRAEVEVAADESGNPVTTTDEETGEETPDTDAEPAMMAEGEIAFGFEDAFSVRFNPDATSPDDAEEWYVGRMWPRKVAAKRFNMAESELESGSDSDREFYKNIMSSAAAGSSWLGQQLSFGSQVGASNETAIGPEVLVVAYYRKPCKDYPKGRHWISIGTKKVSPIAGEEAVPYGFWPPLVPVQSLPIPGQPQAMAPLGQVIPLNEALNTLDGKILEHNVLMAMGGKWITHPEDASLEITSDPGQNMASKGYAAGCPPIQARLESLPAEVYGERAVLFDKLRMTLSLSEAETSEGPASSSGREVLVRQEVTDSVLGPDLDAWELAQAEIGRRMLVLAQQYYREERSMAIRGERGRWEIRSFTGADLSDGLDVRVQQGSTMPWSKAAQLDVKLETLTKFPGLVTNPQTGEVDKEQLAEYLDTGNSGLASFESDEDPDLVEINREHAMFEAFDASMDPDQALPKIALWQTHPKHLEGHFRFMKIDYERFKRWSPDAQQAFLAHMEETVRAVDEIAGQVSAGAPVPEAGGTAETTPGSPPALTVENGGAGAQAGAQAGAPAGSPAGQRPVLQNADFAAAGQ